MLQRYQYVWTAIAVSVLVISTCFFSIALAKNPKNPGDNNTIFGCYQEETGIIRVVTDNSECNNCEMPISWNIVGPQGEQGPEGEPGPEGPEGPEGPQGEKGDCSCDVSLEEFESLVEAYNDLLLRVIALEEGGATCGNGIVEPGEECDDGNSVSGDGCSSTCKYEPAECDCVPYEEYESYLESLSPSIIMPDFSASGTGWEFELCPTGCNLNPVITQATISDSAEGVEMSLELDDIQMDIFIQILGSANYDCYVQFSNIILSATVDTSDCIGGKFVDGISSLQLTYDAELLDCGSLGSILEGIMASLLGAFSDEFNQLLVDSINELITAGPQYALCSGTT